MQTETRTNARPKNPVEHFVDWLTAQEAAAGLLLIVFAVIALVWANSPWGATYDHLLHLHANVGIGEFALDLSLLHWVNDGLMVIFFFLVGLEIKREFLTGELSTPKEAALPMVAALGGILLPAALYVAFNAGGVGISGWGVPMATDIAFAIGVMALLGSRAPLALKVFLTALAIVDDLAAVLVIALFYTADLSLGALGIAGLFFLAMVLLNVFRFRAIPIYLVFGLGLWIATLQSGVHATVAGVLAALTIPDRRQLDFDSFLHSGREVLDEMGERISMSGEGPTEEETHTLHEIEERVQEAGSPLRRLEHALDPWVYFVILPIFALGNAGVVLSGEMATTAFGSASAITVGVIVGLVLGKQVGVTLFSWIAVEMGWADLPGDVNWTQLYGVAWLTGIGFTMSLFIANLAFADQMLLDSAKIGILLASTISGLGGWVVLTYVSGAED